MTPAALAFAGLGFGAALVGLYLVRLRRRRLVVPHLRLWEAALVGPRLAAPWRKLRRLGSLLVQLGILALLVAAAADPRPAARDARTVVVLVDASASMQAKDGPRGEPRLEAAKRAARAIVDGLAAGERATLVQLDGAPAPVRSVDEIVAGDAAADVGAGLRLAADLLQGATHPTAILVGDGAGWQPALDEAKRALGGIDLRWQRIGTAHDDVGIAAFAVRRVPRSRTSFEVLVDVVSWRDRPSTVNLELRQEGAVVDVERLDLAPGAHAVRTRADLASDGAHLEARLVDPNAATLDAFPLDDTARALLPPARRQRVLLVTDGNLFLEGALLLDADLAVDKVAPAAWDAARAAGYDALVLDGFVPPAVPRVPTLWVDPRGAASPFAVAGRDTGLLVTGEAPRHPVMRDVTLADVNAKEATRFRPAPGDVVLASSLGAPVAVAREKPVRAVALGFDVRRSDLPLRVAFPLLVANVFDWFAGDDTRAAPTGRAGHPVDVAVEGARTATVVAPDGSRRTVEVVGGKARVMADKIGTWRVEAAGRVHELAVNLADPGESAIGPPATLALDGKTLPPPDPPVRRGRREPWTLLVLAALAVSLVEWLTYHRRVTS